METSENLETQNLESMNWGLDKKIPNHIEGHQCINTARTTEDIHHQVNDGHDVFYSLDGKRLINATGHLTRYTVTHGTQVICHGAFCETYATEIILPDTILAIGFNPFGRTRLKKLVLPKLIVLSPYFVVEQGVLYTSDYKICYGAVTKDYPKNLTIHKGTEIIANSAFFRRQLNSVYIPDSVREIGYAAFAYTDLKEVRLPHSIDEIPEACFQCCSLTSVVIPEYVNNIGEDAFSNNEKLESISMLGMVESMGYGTLSCCPHLFKITGPSGSKILNLKTVQKAGLCDRKELHSRRESSTVNGRRVTTMYLM